MALTSEESSITNVVCFKDFLNQWIYELKEKKVGEGCMKQSGGLMTSFDEFAAEFMSPEVLIELDAECSPATLTCDFEPQDPVSLVTNVPTFVDLECLQHQKVELARRAQDSVYRSKAGEKMKYRARDGPWKHYSLQTEDSSGKIQDDTANVNAVYPDILVTVQLYRPYKKRKNLSLEQEFHVLGQQRLSELRDKIVCISDHLTVGDFSDNPDTHSDTITKRFIILPRPIMPRGVVVTNARSLARSLKDLFKSGFFFIEGVFYNDMRSASSQDYSRPIIEWAKDPSRGIGPFQSRLMENTSFIDLSARLGQPYCYTHQGDCEHIIIFTDLRILHPDDCQRLNMYPILIFKSRERKSKCRVCLMYMAKWVTLGSQLAPEDPCFFCETCFRALHYDSNGRKLVSDMKVYPIQDVRMLRK